MELLTAYHLESPIELLHARVVEWIADERFFYNELRQLAYLTEQKKIYGKLGEQLRKDVLRNLKSMLNVLLEDLGKSEKYISLGLREEPAIGGIPKRADYEAITAKIQPIRKKIWRLELRTLGFLKRTCFSDGRNYQLRYELDERTNKHLSPNTSP